MSALFSMMRNEFMPASRSLMPMQRPEKPAPTMMTTTCVTEGLAGIGISEIVARRVAKACTMKRGAAVGVGANGLAGGGKIGPWRKKRGGSGERNASVAQREHERE